MWIAFFTCRMLVLVHYLPYVVYGKVPDHQMIRGLGMRIRYLMMMGIVPLRGFNIEYDDDAIGNINSNRKL